MSENVNYPAIGGNPYSIPDAGEEGWPELTQYLVALAGGQSTGAQKVAARVATSSPVTVASASDCLVAVKLTVPGAPVVNLPAGVVGQYFAIGDGTGDAATNNITIVPNGTDKIAGNNSYILAQDGASVMLGFTGAGNWSIMAQAAGEGSGGGVSRSALDAGIPGYVVINNDTTGLLAQEHYLATKRGGLGVDASAFTGVLKAIAGVIAASALTNADIPTGIDAAKINTGVVSNAEFNFLDGVTSAIQTQLNAKQAAGSYITALVGDVTASGPGSATASIGNAVITNAHINGAAGIAFTKMETLTVNRVPITDGSGKLTTSGTTGTEIGFVSGVTSAIQTQLDARVVGPASVTAGQLPIYSGTTGKIITNFTGSGIVKVAAGFVTSSAVALNTGDVTGVLPIANGGTGQSTRQTAIDALVPVQTGNTGKVLQTDGSTVTWQTVAAGGGLATSYQAANVSPAVTGTIYLMDSTASARSVTLPTGAAGNQIMVVDDKGTAFGNNITIAPATGQQIGSLGANTTITININRGWIWLFWDGSVWAYITSSAAGAGGLSPVLATTTVPLAVINTMYECTSTNGFTITLPTIPASGGVIGIMDAGETCSANNYIDVVAASGQTIDGQAVGDVLRMDYARANIVLYAAPSATSWKVQYQAATLQAGYTSPEIPLTVTATMGSWVTTRAVGVYYVDGSGNHRMKFNLFGTCSSGSRPGGTLTIAGTVFKNVSGFRQPVSGYHDASANFYLTGAYVIQNTGDISVNHAAATTTAYAVSGDVELDSRPTWA